MRHATPTTMRRSVAPQMLHLLMCLMTMMALAHPVSAFAPRLPVPVPVPHHQGARRQRQHTNGVFRTILAAMGPVARARKAMNPEDYNRVVEQKMTQQEGLTRRQAEDEYNSFLENPDFYYALDKKEAYYKSLGYKDLFEGMIGEAEKEGRGDEVRARIANFRRESKIKAFSVLTVFILGFCYLYQVYHADPANFITGLPMRNVV